MKRKSLSKPVFSLTARRRLIAALSFAIALAASVFGAIFTEPGARAVWRIATWMVPDMLSGELVSGTLNKGINFRSVVYRDSGSMVKIDSLAISWSWSRAPLKLTVHELRLGVVDLTLLPTPRAAITLPRQLILPLAAEIRNATLQQLVIRRDASTTAVSDIRLQARSDRVRHELTLEHATARYGNVYAVARLNGVAPFITTGAARMSGSWREENYRVEAKLDGTLQALDLQLDVIGDRINGRARIEATPFDPIPIRRARFGLRHLNPQLFSAGAPRADLDLDADLAPSGKPDTEKRDVSPFAVAGPISLANALPGPIDAGLLPLVSAKADITLDAQHQQWSRMLIRLSGGTLQGTGEMDHAGQGHLALQVSDIDPHALHTRLKSLPLSGSARLDTGSGTQRLSVKLSAASLAIAADAQITPQQIEVGNALLEAGSASLHVSGTLARNEQNTFSIRGRLADFNPARFLARQAYAGSEAETLLPDARINADFDAQGARQPEWTGQMQFNVQDSTYAGLPMYGKGRLRFTGIRHLAGDVQLAVAGNALQLTGGFGKPTDRLKFNVEAPSLARLGFGLSGSLKAQGELGGTLEHPIIDAGFHAEQLTYRESRLAHLASHIRTQGVPGRNADARIMLDFDARDVRSDRVTLNQVRAAVNGTYGRHTISLSADGQLRGKPLAMKLGAQGALRELSQGYSWDGRLNKLANDGFPRLSLTQPLSVGVTPQRLTLGATHITLEQAQIDLKSLQLDETQFSSEGSFSALDFGHLLEMQREIGGNVIPIKTDLILDGRWKLSLTASADGFFIFERRRGDIRVMSGSRENALGIKTLQLRGDMQGQTLRLALDAEATRIGTLNGHAQIALQQANGYLRPTSYSPVSGHVTALVPRLQSIASLAGPKVGFDGSFNIDLTASGTLGAPLLAGDAIGRNLALTIYDQGVRLRDGSAQLRLIDDVVELRQLELHGGEGTLSATGRIPIGGTASMLSASIAADRLQLLSKPYAQLTVSGQAKVADAGGTLEINGKLRADNARFRLPEKSAPALDSDVLVIRGKERTAGSAKNAPPAIENPAGPLTPRVAIDFELGENFRFEGSGADVLLGGTLAIESTPGDLPKASGTVRIVDGTYEAFGTKLTIERGLLNFHQAFANPDVNILAMRRDKEVAAGVQITGTVRQPRVQLISEPEVTEEDKLSWLVFGRAGTSSEAGSVQAQAAAREAALGLFNRVGGARIAKGFGLDQLAVGNSEFGLGTQQVVSLGKEISNRLYIGYEQSLAGAAGVLKLTYDWTRHWSVVVRGGTIGGLDVLYNKRFDAGGPERR